MDDIKISESRAVPGGVFLRQGRSWIVIEPGRWHEIRAVIDRTVGTTSLHPEDS